MNPLPDFSSAGYCVLRMLKANAIANRVTYLATDQTTQQPVVIKHFQFGRLNADWSAFQAIEREMGVLRKLNHPHIPLYVGSFETPDGFCLVQEYKDAPSLAVPRNLTVENIQQIATAVLEILIYLQAQIPPVIHRDLKPDNILVDERLQVYLVDFGFASVVGGERSLSSSTFGTLGFMPPEQLYNRPLTPATDLYSLGVTLICLLTNTPATAVETLINAEGRVAFDPAPLNLSPSFSNGLMKLVQPDPHQRFASAEIALTALNPLPLSRLKESSTSAATHPVFVGGFPSPIYVKALPQKTTAPRPAKTYSNRQDSTEPPPLLSLTLLGGLAFLVAPILFTSAGWTAIGLVLLTTLGSGLIGAVVGAIAALVGREFNSNIKVLDWMGISAVNIIVVAAYVLSLGIYSSLVVKPNPSIAGILLILMGGTLAPLWVPVFALAVESTLKRRSYHPKVIRRTLGLTVGLGLSLAFPLTLGISSTLVTTVILVLSLLNVGNLTYLFYLSWSTSRVIAQLRDPN
jgi:hypothetical protein